MMLVGPSVFSRTFRRKGFSANALSGDEKRTFVQFTGGEGVPIENVKGAHCGETSVSVLLTPSSRPPGCSATVWQADHTHRWQAPDPGATRKDADPPPTAPPPPTSVRQSGRDKRFRPSTLAQKSRRQSRHPEFRVWASSPLSGARARSVRVSAALAGRHR